MQPVKVTIYGSFWDSQIYSGELILFDEHGGMHKVDWRAFVDDLAQKNSAIQTALRVAFLDGDLFYNPNVRKILLDPELTAPIKKQLEILSTLNLAVEPGAYSRRQESPFDFLPTDTEVYYNIIFASGDDGLFSSPRSTNRIKTFFHPKATRHHDGRLFQVKASDRYTSIATAAGSDGLLEFPFNREDRSQPNRNGIGKLKTLAEKPCSACDWAFQSVMGWAADGAFLASFKEEKNPDGRGGHTRRLERVVEMSEVFNRAYSQIDTPYFAWGAREKIYLLTDSGIEVCDYNPSVNKTWKTTKKKTEMFGSKGTIPSSIITDQVIATSTAPFGTVIELDDQLVVFRSDNKVEKFLGEPVHWRVFPRSEHYSNQLHIIYEDRIEIISFVHDYFVKQKDKLAGFSRNAGDDVCDAFSVH